MLLQQMHKGIRVFDSSPGRNAPFLSMEEVHRLNPKGLTKDASRRPWKRVKVSTTLTTQILPHKCPIDHPKKVFTGSSIGAKDIVGLINVRKPRGRP